MISRGGTSGVQATCPYATALHVRGIAVWRRPIQASWSWLSTAATAVPSRSAVAGGGQRLRHLRRLRRMPALSGPRIRRQQVQGPGLPVYLHSQLQLCTLEPVSRRPQPVGPHRAAVRGCGSGWVSDRGNMLMPGMGVEPMRRERQRALQGSGEGRRWRNGANTKQMRDTRLALRKSGQNWRSPQPCPSPRAGRQQVAVVVAPTVVVGRRHASGSGRLHWV